MNNQDQPKTEPKPRQRRKYITKEDRRRQWGVRPLPPLHTEKKSDEEK